MKDMPWMKFYPADWRAEKGLKLISRAARSLWIDLLCLMFESGTGRLEINGHPATENELSKIFGDNPRTIKKLISEIELAGVSSRDQDGFIISRRIIKDRIKVEQDISNGRKGGNPSLKNNNLEENGVNPPDKAQILEARSYIPEAIELSKNLTLGELSLENLEISLRKAAGWEQEPHPNLCITGPVMALIESGANLERDVLPVVAAISSKAHSRTGWNYFVPAIKKAMADRLSAGKPIEGKSEIDRAAQKAEALRIITAHNEAAMKKREALKNGVTAGHNG